jgi:hypothetical protein
VAPDVSKQVRGVRAASTGVGLLIHSCFCMWLKQPFERLIHRFSHR